MCMKVKVSIGGLLVKPRGKSEAELDLADNATVKDMLLALGYEDAHVPRIMASVNGTIRRPDYSLKDGDDVKLSILVGGG
ncbi:MAG: MoaD/ThiS family protein [Elusimicrobiota bacterium]